MKNMPILSVFYVNYNFIMFTTKEQINSENCLMKQQSSISQANNFIFSYNLEYSIISVAQIYIFTNVIECI